MKTLNCGAMEKAGTLVVSLEHYFSPSQSSLKVLRPQRPLKCHSGKDTIAILPVLFSAARGTVADLTVQVCCAFNSVSRHHFFLTLSSMFNFITSV